MSANPDWKKATTLVVSISTAVLASMGAADNIVETKKPSPIALPDTFVSPVPKAVCGPGDQPETGLQGQVPMPLRLQPGGFQGFSCNLKLIGQVRGEGANWQSTEWREGRGKNKKVCAYHGTAHPTANPGLMRTNYGVRVIDVSDPARPVTTAYLTTTSMLDPWESLKVNERRRLLGAGNGSNGNGPAAMDIYDISGDCTHPQLLASTFISVDPNTEVVVPGLTSHEGSWAPDGLTYYARGNRNYYAVDTINTLAPKVISAWLPPLSTSSGHGLSVSDDGTRGYFVSNGQGGGLVGLLEPNIAADNGLLIYDLSEIQARRANPQVRLVGSVYWKDGSVAQHTINIKVKGKPYVVHVDEFPTAGAATGLTMAGLCAIGGFPLGPQARIIDIGDEKNPKVISKLQLEVHDPANCDAVLADVVGPTQYFFYGSHYCSVDNRQRATTLACGYFMSGIRVFDIRDPVRPREIAYYNPAGTATFSPGSNQSLGNSWTSGGPDWCTAQVHLDAEQGTLWTTCQDNGLLLLKFTHNAWPFAETRTPPGMQN